MVSASQGGGSSTATMTESNPKSGNNRTSPSSAPQIDPSWLEALGVTSEGTCLRHPNCPVWVAATQTVMGCRMCSSEDATKNKSVKQRQNFAAVVQELQQQKQENTDKTKGKDSEAGANSSVPLVLKQSLSKGTAASKPAPLMFDSILKRLSQVQSWTLRHKEQECMSLQLHISKLEQKLDQAEGTVAEQNQTIRALRRTIQQDLKVIKTMATHHEQLQASQHYYAMRPTDDDEITTDSGFADEDEDDHRGSPLRLPRNLQVGASVSDDSSSSPTRRVPPNRNASFGSVSTPDQSPAGKDPRANAQMQFFQRANMARGGPPSNLPMSEPTKGVTRASSRRIHRSTRSFDGESIPEDSPAHRTSSDLDMSASQHRRGSTSSYWNESELNVNPSQLFRSFRGGLLDIPKEPPKPTHQNKDDKKLSLDPNAMNALSMPKRGVLSRHNSAEVTEFPLQLDPPPLRGGRRKPKPKIHLDMKGPELSEEESAAVQAAVSDNNQEIPLGLLAETLTALPSRKLDAKAPNKLFTNRPGPPMLETESPQPQQHLKQPQQQQRSPPLVHHLERKPNVAHTRGVNKNVSQVSNDSEPTFADNATLAAKGDTDDENSFARSAVSADSFTAETTLTEANNSEAPSAVAGASSPTDKFLFPVTGARCQDRYGDAGDYTGTILVTEGLPHGSGTMTYENGRIYTGEWVAGQWNGKGKLLNPNGDTYEGEFVLDARHGKGVYQWDNGDIYTGMFREDKRHGHGKFCFHNGNVYEGDFCDGMFDGFGKYKFDGGYYEGDWKEGKYDGNGELHYANGLKYSGEFRNSVAHGFGIEVAADGTKRRGLWENGQPAE